MGRDIESPDKWYNAFKERAPEKGFDTADEYVNYVLKQIYEKLQRQQQDDSSDTEYSEEEEEKVKDRLRGLGYLD